jgi:WD40 repeat protein/DNA-binding SARP family transcriptional activator
VEFRILGPLEVVQDGESVVLGATQQRALLAVLVLHRGETVSIDRLVDELWGERASANAAKTVHVYVSRLRKELGSDVILTQGRGYRLAIEPEQIDADQFDAIRAAGRRALADGDPVRARERLCSAMALWRGEPLADFAYEPFAQDAITRLDGARVAALEDRIDADLALGSDGELVPELESLISSNPLRERLRGQLMLALYRAGRQADALAAYRETSELLRDELGLEPSRMLQELERSILEHDASLDRVTATGGISVAVCPFKGLAFFDRADAEYFCGRERLVSELLARLVESPLVGIIGSSGVGKSSLLRAGVLPALSGGSLPGSGEWRQVLLRPGAHPRAELGRALDGERLGQALGQLSSGERLVIAVDQLEELFTLCEREEERAAFLDELDAAARDPDRRALVVVSVRADFYGHLASFPRFAERLSRSHVLVGPMDRDELARAIEQPAARAGLELEHGLADALVSDVAGEPGGLPLLSTTLLELWRAGDGRALRYDSYRTGGGVRGAVARLAEDAYTQLGESEQRIARAVMLRLASGEDGTLARRRVPLVELERLNGAAPVLAELTDARLLTVSDGRVELSHEALLREWPRYRTWLEEDRIGRRVHTHLTTAANDWEARGRDVADVYRGARLAAALEWRAGHEHELTQTERAFLDAGRATAGRAQRRLRMVLAAVAALLAVAVAGGIVALDQRSSARSEARVAEAQRLGVQAVSEPRLDRSLLLARQGVALDDSPATRSYLLDALLRSPAAIRVIGGAGNPLDALDLSPDGRTLAAGDTPGNVLFLDAGAGRRVGRPYTALGAISAVRFSPDGRNLAVAVGGQSVDILDAGTHRYTRRLFVAPPSTSTVINNPWVLGTIAFSPDSRELWADVIHNQPRGSSRYIVRWDTRSGRRLGRPRQIDPTSQAALVGFTRRGAQLVTSSGAARATVIRDAATLRPLRRLRGGSARTALSPDGRVVALGGADGSVRLLDLRTGDLRVATDHHDAAVTDLRFASDSRTLLTAGADGRVIEWNVADARRIETFTGHTGTVSRVTIAPDDQTAYSAGADGAVIAWDLAHNRRLDRPFSSPRRHAMIFPVTDRGANGPTILSPGGVDVPVPELAIATTPGGSSFAVPDDAGYVDAFDSRTLTASRRIPVSPGRQVSAVALAPDGQTVAATTSDGHLRFADLRDLRRLGALQPAYSDAAWSLNFSGDGRWLATAGFPTSTSPPLQLWNVRRRRVANTSLLSPPYAVPSDVTFSPDGRKLAAAVTDEMGTGSALEILAVPSLEQLTKIPTPVGTSVRFSPDGRLLLFGDVQGRVWRFDTRTWRPRGRPLLAHTGAVTTLNFSPDGQKLATTSDDGTTRLWDVPSGRPTGTALPGFAQRYVAAAFVDGGTHLVTLDDNGRGYLWDIQPQSWARRACEVAGRTLTRAEWNDALPERTYAPACAPR